MALSVGLVALGAAFAPGSQAQSVPTDLTDMNLSDLMSMEVERRSPDAELSWVDPSRFHLAYRYVRFTFDGYRDGTDNVSDGDLIGPLNGVTYPILQDKIVQQAHTFELGYDIARWASIYLMLPYVQQIIGNLVPGVPVINFATANPELLPLLAEANSAVVGVDWRIRLDQAWHTIGYERAVQGNLEPAVLLADRDEIRRRAKEILVQAAGRPGHIFNLGHGVLQQTPVEHAIALVDAVHEMSAA